MTTRLLASRMEFDAFARDFAATLQAGDVVALSGDLGAGKTAFVRAAADALGVTDDVSSPTFIFRQRYAGPIPIEHLDLYRIENPAQLDELGLEEAFDPGAIVFVEWPECAPTLVPASAIALTISGSGEEPRVVTVERA